MSKYYLRWLTPIFLFLLGALSSNSGVSWGHFISPLAAKSFSLSVPWESMCLLRALCGYILPFSVWCGHFYVALPCPTWTSIPIQSLHRCPYVFQMSLVNNFMCLSSVQWTSVFLLSHVFANIYPPMPHADIPLGSSSVACGPIYPFSNANSIQFEGWRPCRVTE